MQSENSNSHIGTPSASPFARVSEAMNLRVRYEDMGAIRTAAGSMGLPMATFVRMAALERAKLVNSTSAS